MLQSDPARRPWAMCISLTAHEELETLIEQVDNVLFFCPRSVVVIHLSADFRAALEASEGDRLRLQVLAEHGRVIINPRSHPTRWAHIYHAHLANLRHVEDLGLDYGSLLLLSSADLIFREGLETHVTGHDAGFDTGEVRPDWYWARAVRTDPVAAEILQRSGRADFVTSLHEGTFYRRAVAVDILQVLEALIPEWDYGDTYVREEVFMPTLAEAAGARRIAPSAAHVLGFAYGEGDRQVMAALFRMMGLADQFADTLLAEWTAENTGDGGGLLDGRYVLSRLPRRPDHPARAMLAGWRGKRAGARARWVAERLSPVELAGLDTPGRTADSQSRPSAVVLKALEAHLEPVFAIQSVREGRPLEIAAPVQAGGFSGTVPVFPAEPERGFLCAYNNRGAAKVTVEVLDGAPVIETTVTQADQDQPDAAGRPFLFFGQRLAPSRSRGRALVIYPELEGPGVYELDIWFEVHRDTPAGLDKRRFENGGLEQTSSHPVLRRWPLPEAVEAVLSGADGGATALVYLRMPIRPARMRFHLLGIGR